MTKDTDHFDRLMEGVRLHASGATGKAAIIYRDLLDQNPNDVNALHLLGMVAHQTGHSQEGAQLVARAMELAPGIPMFHNNFGKILLELNQLDAAGEHLLEATRAEPENVAPMLNLAECYRRQGRHEQVESVVRIIIERKPDLIDAHVCLAKSHLDRNEPDTASGILESVLVNSPEHREALFHMARTRFAQRDYQSTINTLTHLLELRPDHYQAWNNLGNACMEAGQPDKAVDAFSRALDGVPDNPGMRYNLALALVETDREDEALPHLAHALEIVPDDTRILGLHKRAVAASATT